MKFTGNSEIATLQGAIWKGFLSCNRTRLLQLVGGYLIPHHWKHIRWVSKTRFAETTACYQMLLFSIHFPCFYMKSYLNGNLWRKRTAFQQKYCFPRGIARLNLNSNSFLIGYCRVSLPLHLRNCPAIKQQLYWLIQKGQLVESYY